MYLTLPPSKVEENAKVRQHVVGITSQLGACLYQLANRLAGSTLMNELDSPMQSWEKLGHKICDFGEYLDADSEEPLPTKADPTLRRD